MPLTEEIEAARESCLQAIQDPPLAGAAALLKRQGITGARARSVLDWIVRNRCPTPAPELVECRNLLAQSGIPTEACTVERAFLLSQAVAAMEWLPSMPAVESVRRLWCREIEGLSHPKPEMLPYLALEGRLYFDLCKIVAGKRYPSGQHHWEVSGFPRSWIVKAPLPQLLRLAPFLLFSTHGFCPFFETHFRFMLPGTPMPKRAFVASFYRMAASLAFQPHVRGVMAVSWLYSADTARVSPTLSFFREVFLEAGALLADLGAAAEHDGFLEGNPHRAQLYRQNQYHPTLTVALCPRKQALDWVNRQTDVKQLADNIRM
jgi:hypothetical protein